jgi:hypothetical protein
VVQVSSLHSAWQVELPQLSSVTQICPSPQPSTGHIGRNVGLPQPWLLLGGAVEQYTRKLLSVNKPSQSATVRQFPLPS